MQQGFTGVSVPVCLQDILNLFEIKNELHSTNSDAFFEALINFYRFLRANKAQTQGRRCSSFITIVAGPWIWSVAGFGLLVLGRQTATAQCHYALLHSSDAADCVMLLQHM